MSYEELNATEDADEDTLAVILMEAIEDGSIRELVASGTELDATIDDALLTMYAELETSVGRGT
jgi:hypothetical protein